MCIVINTKNEYLKNLRVIACGNKLLSLLVLVFRDPRATFGTGYGLDVKSQ